MIAFLRRVNDHFGRREAVRGTRRPIRIDRARKQHDAYAAILRELGASVEFFDDPGDLAHGVFVEDLAILLPELAVIARLGSPGRAAEVEAVAAVLAQYGPLQRLADQGRIEGGDVLRIGRTLYIGLTPTTNEEGAAGVREIVEPFDYAVRTVETHDCGHLKAACSYIPPRFLLVNPAWVNPATFADLTVIRVPDDEPLGANTLTVAGTTLVAGSCSGTEKRLKEAGVVTRPVDISEFEKVEGRLTALSLILESRQAPAPAPDPEMRALQVPEVPAPAGHASQAIVHAGLVHVSLLLPFEPGPSAPGRMPVEKQTELALQNLGVVLVAAGSSFGRVLRVTIHLADVKHLERIEPIYADVFNGHRPARSVVENGALAPGVLVAVEAVAAAGA